MRYKQETEKQARQDIAERLEEISQFLQAQAASQEDLLREYKRASVSQMEHRVKGLETELKSKTFQFDCNEKELEKYRQLYLEELENGMSLASQLNLAGERLFILSIGIDELSIISKLLLLTAGIVELSIISKLLLLTAGILVSGSDLPPLIHEWKGYFITSTDGKGGKVASSETIVWVSFSHV
nr:ankyrin repeat domain-containing protein 26-like [Camelus dromedarius]